MNTITLQELIQIMLDHGCYCAADDLAHGLPLTDSLDYVAETEWDGHGRTARETARRVLNGDLVVV